MEPNGPKTQHAICMTCDRVITRHYLTSEWGAWLHLINRLGRTDHAAIPREVQSATYMAGPYEMAGEVDLLPEEHGDFSDQGKRGPSRADGADPRCADCGGEVDHAGQQCTPCKRRDYGVSQ